jgi:hypothetical protein
VRGRVMGSPRAVVSEGVTAEEEAEKPREEL